MLKIGKYIYKLSRWQFDFEDKLSLISLMNLLLESAGKHAEERGFGIEKLISDGRSWVLLRVRIEFFKEFSEKNEIQIETWVDEIKGLFTTRRFNISDSQNQILAAASTTWAMIDIKNRKMVPLTELIKDEFLLTDKELLTSAPQKIPPIELQHLQTRKVKALYSSIDINHHVTTTRYIQWILDSFPIELFEKNYIKVFEVNFQNECKYSDVLELATINPSKNVYLCEMTKSCEIQICRSRISFVTK